MQSPTFKTLLPSYVHNNNQHIQHNQSSNCEEKSMEYPTVKNSSDIVKSTNYDDNISKRIELEDLLQTYNPEVNRYNNYISSCSLNKFIKMVQEIDSLIDSYNGNAQLVLNIFKTKYCDNKARRFICEIIYI